MPLDPVQLGAQVTTVITWCLAGLNGWGTRVIPLAVRNAMDSCLTSAQAFVSSDRWAPWIQSLNGK